jgi:hypothetical protein
MGYDFITREDTNGNLQDLTEMEPGISRRERLVRIEL